MRNIKLSIAVSILILVFISFACRDAAAQIRAGSFTVSPYTGVYVFDDDQNIDNAPVHGIGFGYNYSEELGVEASFNYVTTDAEDTDENIEAYLYRMDALYHLMPRTKIVPYVAAGAGAITINDGRTGSDDDFIINYGAGIKWFMSRSLTLRGDVRHILDFGDSDNNFAFTLGFSYLIGGKEPGVVPSMDADGDGIYDDLDQCPDTPAGAVVDSIGCPKDTDGDGVYDGLDECPYTPRGAVVDSTGCPEDSDGDGVYDGLDECPNTPRGAVVDSAGCPKDSDGDGVYDGLDQCPDTPRGIKVDEKGCPVPIKEKVTIELKVEFEFDRAEVKSIYQDHIEKVAAFLKAYPETEAVIEGHTDSRGTDQYNLRLSSRRAENVMKQLINYGIDPSRMRAVGQGESMPVADNATEEGRQQNRRVVAVISTVITK